MFRAGVEYVTVDVIVADRSDHVVPDLRKDDFEIHEGSRRQAIADFRYVSVPLQHRVIDPVAGAAAPEPDVVVNAPPKPDSRLWVIVIDDLHILPQDIGPVRRIVTDFLRQLSPDDEVAITFASRSDLAQDFTSDFGRLTKVLGRIREVAGMGLDAAPDDLSPVDALPAARSTIMVLNNVAAALAASGHARRAVVLVSGGTTLRPGDSMNSEELPEFHGMEPIVNAELTDAFDTARHAGVPIYTIDPRGLVTPETAVDSPWKINDEGQYSDVQRRIRIQQDYRFTIAVQTGGRAFINQSNLDAAVEQIVTENGSYYLLGYYPRPYSADGKFHPITVTVDRPGVIARARQGYLADKPEGERPKDARAAINAALGETLPSAGLALRAFAAPTMAGRHGARTAVTVEVAYPAADNGAVHLDDELQFGVVAVDADGQIKASSQRAAKFGLARRPDGTLSYAIDDELELAKGALTLRIAAASKALGSVGTVHLPLVVPDLSGKSLRMSALVIGLNDRGPAAALPVARAESIRDLVPFQPITTRTFSRSDTLRLYARIQWTGADDHADVVIGRHGNGLVVERDVGLGAVGDGGRRKHAILDVPVALDDLAPGVYGVTSTPASEAQRRSNGPSGSRSAELGQNDPRAPGARGGCEPAHRHRTTALPCSRSSSGSSTACAPATPPRCAPLWHRRVSPRAGCGRLEDRRAGRHAPDRALRRLAAGGLTTAQTGQIIA